MRNQTCMGENSKSVPSGRAYSGLSFLVSVLNMSNEVFGFYNGRVQYMNQREFYKPTFEFGFRWDSAAGK